MTKERPTVMRRLVSSVVHGTLQRFGYQLTLTEERQRRNAAAQQVPIPDKELYLPLFAPWKGAGEFGGLRDAIRQWTLVSSDRLWILYTLSRQALSVPGEFWECGVYKGGTAMLFGELLRRHSDARTFRLFDTFAGIPKNIDAGRDHPKMKGGEFGDVSVDGVRNRVARAGLSLSIHPGFIPDTFSGLESSRIAFAHVDVDIYRSVRDCCEFIYPRLSPGAFMVFDDYGFKSCPGARAAVDEYFADKPERPLVLGTGQAVVFRAPGAVART